MANDISSFLVKGLDKTVVLKLATEVGLDHDLYVHLLKLIEKGETTPSMKASWILSTVSEVNPTFATNNASQILKLLQGARIGGVQRELIKTLYEIPLKNDQQGQFIDICFRLLTEPKSDVGVKHYCAGLLEKASVQFPELKNELIALLQSQQELYTPAWQRYTRTRLLRLTTEHKRIIAVRNKKGH